MMWTSDLCELVAGSLARGKEEPEPGVIFWRDLLTPDPEAALEFVSACTGLAEPLWEWPRASGSASHDRRSVVGGVVEHQSVGWRSWIRCDDFEELRTRVAHENAFEPGCATVLADLEHQAFGELLALRAKDVNLVFVESAGDLPQCTAGSPRSSALRRTLSTLDANDRSLVDSLRKPGRNGSLGVWPPTHFGMGLVPDLWVGSEAIQTVPTFAGTVVHTWRSTTVVTDLYGAPFAMTETS